MDANYLVLSILMVITLTAASSEFEKTCLMMHNKYRMKHKAPPLKLDSVLSKECEAHAIASAAKNSLTHSAIGNVGENLCTILTRPEDCVTIWYKEKNGYCFDKPIFSVGTGHFTQLVWKSSTKFGIGKAESENGVHYVVARYKPRGNVIGKFQNNVFPSSCSHLQCNIICIIIYVSVKWLF